AKRIFSDLEKGKYKLVYVMVNLVHAALAALAYTNDIFTGYVFIEICTIASCALLMARSHGKSLVAATRYMIFSLMGSGLVLIGIILLYSITGHLLFPQMYQSVQSLWTSGEYRIPLTVAIGLLVSGLAIKSGLFPFHFWMPDTYGYACAASSGILSGIVSKGYIFLLIKIIYRCFGTDAFYASGIDDVLYIFGVCAMIFGSLEALRENEINRMTAFSSAAQIGYIYMGIGLSPTLGMTAAMFHIVFHTITKPMLFLANGKLVEASGNMGRFHDLRGSALRNKMAGVAYCVGAMSMVGIPSMMGFVSKLLFAQAAIEGKLKMVITLCALALSTILNTMYFLRTIITLYAPPAHDVQAMPSVKRGSQKGFAFVSFIFILLNLFFGVYSQPLVEWIRMGLVL
ncbi:MAG: sodium:proton antiporter, partial [Clostridia bacterium]|nr:sodium:proton antiporter [Clostridia bacterium]